MKIALPIPCPCHPDRWITLEEAERLLLGQLRESGDNSQEASWRHSLTLTIAVECGGKLSRPINCKVFSDRDTF